MPRELRLPPESITRSPIAIPSLRARRSTALIWNRRPGLPFKRDWLVDVGDHERLKREGAGRKKGLHDRHPLQISYISIMSTATGSSVCVIGGGFHLRV